METIKALKKLRKCMYQGKDISESDAEYYYDVLDKTQGFGLTINNGKYTLCRENGTNIRRPSLVLTRLIKDLQSIQKYKAIVHEDLLEACNNNDYDGIQTIFDLCNDEDLFEIMITIGKDYQVPLIALVHCKQFSQRITVILDQCKPCQSITSIVTLPHHPKIHSKLMKLGCHLINTTRKIITHSWNHPSQNGIDKADLKHLIVQRDANIAKGTIARNEVLKKSNLETDIVKVICTNQQDGTTTFGVILSDNLRKSMIIAYLKPAIETHIGNCLECALVALQNLDESVSGEVMQLNRGDHAVLILKDAIVVDPWFGAIYPKAELPQKMMTYIEATSGTGKTVNICTNAKVGTFDTLQHYCLSKNGCFYITCENSSKQFAILSRKLK
jgi:hypothetical protein